MSGGGVATFTRAEWAALARVPGHASSTMAEEVAAGEPVTADEVASVYLPLAHYLELRRGTAGAEARAVDGFLAGGTSRSPYVIGIAGGVAVGKTTVARVLEGVLSRGPGTPRVELVSTDAFLLPNRVLEERGLMGRKGFPDTYDHVALLEALAAIRSGADEVAVPVYSHQAYDVLAHDHRTIVRPDIVVVEGLTVLQTGPSDGLGQQLVSDFLDVGLYIDSAEEDAETWFTERLLGMGAAGAGSGPFLQWLSSLGEDGVRELAAATWSAVNLVNVRRHVAPTRSRADVVLLKDRDHRVRQVTVRRP